MKLIKLFENKDQHQHPLIISAFENPTFVTDLPLSITQQQLDQLCELTFNMNDPELRLMWFRISSPDNEHHKIRSHQATYKTWNEFAAPLISWLQIIRNNDFDD